VQQLEYELPLRMEAVHERLHPHDAALDAVLDRVARLVGGPRRRLLAEDVLARVRRALRPLGVQVVRQRDVDRVDVVGGEQLLV